LRRPVPPEAFCDIPLGRISPIADLVTKLKVSGRRSAIDGLEDFDIQLVHPLPRQQVLNSIDSSHGTTGGMGDTVRNP
jgi:hypothetical protein